MKTAIFLEFLAPTRNTD